LQKQNINKALKDIIIIIIGVAVVWLGLRAAFATENPFYVVSSESMVPTLNVYDVIIVKNGSTFDDLKVGDIIVFHSPSDYDRVIVHRVVKIQSGSEKIITTKGDNNPASIPGIDYPIGKREYIGKVVFVIPKLGLVSKALTPPINYIIIGIILAMIFISKLNDKGKDGKQSMQDARDSYKGSSNNTTTSSMDGLDPNPSKDVNGVSVKDDPNEHLNDMDKSDKSK
jgi:signal peptidase